jgi:hypothetical protein
MIDQRGPKSQCYKDISSPVADRNSTELSDQKYFMPKFEKGDEVFLYETENGKRPFLMKVHAQKQTEQFDQGKRYISWQYQLKGVDGALYKGGEWIAQRDLLRCS